MIKLVKFVLALILGGLLIVAGLAGGGGWSLMALTETYEGRVLLCGVMGAAGVIVTALATALVWVANGFTEVRRPLGRWVAVFVAVFIAPALLALIIVTGFEVTHWIGDHITFAAVFVFVAGLLAAGLLAIKLRRRADPEPVVVEAAALPRPEPVLPDCARPVVGWSMPTPERQWDQR